MIITVVGAISAEDAVARIESAHSVIGTRLIVWHYRRLARYTVLMSWCEPVDMPDKSQSDIVLRLPGPLPAHPIISMYVLPIRF